MLIGQLKHDLLSNVTQTSSEPILLQKNSICDPELGQTVECVTAETSAT